MKKEISNQLPCLKEEMLRRVCEAWYIVRQIVLEELNNSIRNRNEDLITTNGGATNTDFIGSMHTGMLFCFHWNVFKYAVVFLLERFFIGTDYMVDMFKEIKWHDNSITCMVKHRPLMYKNVKKLLKYCVVKLLL